MIRIWLVGLLRRQPARLAGAATGVAIAVALLASLGAFLAHAKATMTSRAAASVSVDWQVQVQPGADITKVADLVARTPAVTASQSVGFTQVPGMSATTAGSTLTTGAGVVVGLPSTYRATFPDEIRPIAGTPNGVLLAQQTASNLHAAPGSTIDIQRPGLAPISVTVDGVIDLPQANSLFQTVGAPPGAQPSAPPDNVIVLPMPQWQAFSAPLQATRPDLVTTQIHVKLRHELPADPAAAYTAVIGAARNVEARAAGTAVVGDNLAAALGAARADAAYAQLLFLFLGLPAAVLAGLLTATVAASGANRRRDEQALLRTRGVDQRRLLRLVGVEAGLIGAAGCAVGLVAATLIGGTAFGSASFGADTGSALLWGGLAVAFGAAVTVAAILVPARRDVRDQTVAASRQAVTEHRRPWWARYGLDVIALVGAGLVFQAASGSGYQLVLAPEGVSRISLSYWPLIGPALLWLGAGLLVWRLVDLLLHRGRRITTFLMRPLGARVAPLFAASMARQRRPLVTAATLLAVAVAFAISTAAFNATYRAQAEAHAQLVNGADVTVTEAPGTHVRPAFADALRAIPGVHGVEPVQHRFAYIGTDLQDLYGVNPATIRSATALQDAYFMAGGSAASLMNTLRTKPDSILVSAETAKDYQLRLGDPITLRMVDDRTHAKIAIPFRYAGIVLKFPTAPKDSFFVANAAYVTARTGSDAVGAFLINTGGSGTGAVATAARRLAGPAATVSEIGSVRGKVGSSLTSVDLAGLTRVELAFALVLAAASGGLVVALGLAERRRGYAIMRVLGARRRHLRAAIVAETTLVGVTGTLGGIVLGAVLSLMLVKILTGVFDPPPSGLSLPWGYLLLVAMLVAGCLVAVTEGALRVAARNLLAAIRRL